MSISSGALTDVTDITMTGTLTDGTASLTGGALTGVGGITMTGGTF
eukprot:CAMPEP_0185742694 /NCGR_PEP_ID=MMETSP1174-20130828/32_1 /TAXON_ID=35687 /ORGANISM="Dictyocha speculum, Strain CCMP1381" /LENGTH=45 /DNA_ID= /DNA_START= /DNA_END= /DNA_ORIENTATION=